MIVNANELDADRCPFAYQNEIESFIQWQRRGGEYPGLDDAHSAMKILEVRKSDRIR